jgi:patatin-like phospholipase/acyl hydrolase
LLPASLTHELPKGWADKTDQLLFVRYNDTGLKQVLEEKFKGWTLGKLPSDKSVIVTALRLGKADEAWQPLIPHNIPMGGLETEEERVGRETSVIDAALCSSAAPLYFPPHEHPKLGYCADGGLFANSPGAAALTTALRSKKKLEDICLLSVGTGSKDSHMAVPPWEYAEGTGGTRCGALAWLSPLPHSGVPAFPLLVAMFDSAAAADVLFCRGVLDKNYLRIQLRLDKDIPLDDTSEKSIKAMNDVVDDYFKHGPWVEDKHWIVNTFLAE